MCHWADGGTGGVLSNDSYIPFIVGDILNIILFRRYTCLSMWRLLYCEVCSLDPAKEKTLK